MEKFAVIAKMRSGSQFFESILNAHPDIYCYGEVFSSGSEMTPNKRNFYSFWLDRIKEDNKNVFPLYKSEIIGEFLTYLYTDLPKKKAIGIDIKYFQLELENLQFLLQPIKQHNVKIIHLIRRNILKHYISIYLHLNRGLYGRKMHDTIKVEPVKVEVKPTIIDELNKLKESRDYYAKLLSRNFEYFELYYEDFSENADQDLNTIMPNVLNQVFDFLNIQNRDYDLRSKLKKTNPAKLCDLIANYDETVNILSGTKWEYLLDE